jgi:hypothetical protein
MSEMTTEEISTEISTLLSRLQILIAELEINAKNAESMVPSLREAVIEQQEQHAAEIAKLTKLQEEEIARIIADKAKYQQGLG